MSELIDTRNKADGFRRTLLATASMLALTACLSSSNGARADSMDADSPPIVWIEVGGQAEAMSRVFNFLDPPFVNKVPAINRAPLVEAQRPSPFIVGEEGKISFAPADTGWVFSASILYGKSDNSRSDHHQSPVPYVKRYFGTVVKSQPFSQKYGDGRADFAESEFVLDFQAGKDVGLGLFGAGGQSTISAGVRYAQFTSRSDVELKAKPQYTLFSPYTGAHYFPPSSSRPPLRYRIFHYRHHSYGASLETRRNMHAVGPSLSWDASLPVMGSEPMLTVDWGLKAAVLFGRQRSHSTHQTTGHYSRYERKRFHPPGTSFSSYYSHAPSSRDSTHGVTIPNLGGTAAISLKFPNAKISLGYRADFFFGAIDNGMDVAHKTDVGFYGPFATISFGFGG